MSDILRVRLLVFGTVQGVGFRPFVDRLARRYSLGGFIRNTARGVTIELEGGARAIEEFCSALTTEAPPVECILCSGSRELSESISSTRHNRSIAGCALRL